jgi:hypothetical protein
MHLRNRIGGPAIVAALSGLGGYGCDAQVGEDYGGEVMLELRGHVIASDQKPAADWVPALVTVTEDAPTGEEGSGATIRNHVQQGRLEGVFPSDFKLSIAGPPPGSEAYPLSLGVIVLVPRDTPASFEQPKLVSTEIIAERDDGFTERRTSCLSSGACVERTYDCALHACEVIAIQGERHEEDGYAGSGLGECGSDVCYSMTEWCRAGDDCYRETRRCDISAPGSELTENDEVKTCTLTSETGDKSVKGIADRALFASDLWVVYTKQGGPIPGFAVAGLRPGYNVVRLTHTSSVEEFTAYANCTIDVNKRPFSETEDPSLGAEDPCSETQVLRDPAEQLIDLNLSERPPF